jgi:hypothetical protein
MAGHDVLGESSVLAVDGSTERITLVRIALAAVLGLFCVRVRVP